MSLRFLDCELDVAGHELRRGGRIVDVEPQVFETLAHLVEHRDRMVPKTELLDVIWGDRFVSESALTSRIKSVRRAVGDDGRAQRVIKTVHGRGYRFVADVAVEAAGAAGGVVSPRPEPVGPAPGAHAHAGETPPGPVAAAVLDGLHGGAGLVVSVRGPSGSGKSDALAEAADVARSRGFLVGSGSSANATLRPGGGVLEALDGITQLDPDLLEKMPPRCAEELRRCIAGEPPTTLGRLVLAVRELLLAATALGPTLLVVDDADYCNEGTRRLIRQLVPMTRRRPLGLVVAHRSDVDFGGPVCEIVLEERSRPSDDGATTSLPGVVAHALALVALGGPSFDRLELEAATGADADTMDRIVDTAIASGVVAATDDGYRFVDGSVVARLVGGIADSERAGTHRTTAERLAAGGAAPERVATHLLAAGETRAAVASGLEAARRAMAAHSYADVRRWVETVIAAADGDTEIELRTLEADALASIGDPGAIAAYRALIERTPAEGVTMVRTKLARVAMLSGDLATADESLAGLEPDGGPSDGPLLLARGMLAYFRGDLTAAAAAAEGARELALTPGAPTRLLDAITLQGLIAHSTGEWFDRLHREMRTNRDRGELLTAVFDAHLCVAEYLLYGPTPYDEVITMARALAETATRAGANPAVAFALAVSGEAALLAGDLEAARLDLEAASALHHEMGAVTGEAHTLQRLAEVEHAAGDRATAHELARKALVLGRWSPQANHLVQRAYGTLIATAATPTEALETAREVADTIDEPTYCELCDVMAYVPMAIAFADTGHSEQARWALARAEHSASFWQGTAWPAAIAEAKACLARCEGNDTEAAALFDRAARLFDDAGQVLDAARCRESAPTPLRA